MKRIVISGASSMIGTALIHAILKQEGKDILIYALTRQDSAHLQRLPVDDRICVVQCELGELSQLSERISETCDVFYHIAWTATGSNRNTDILDQCKNIEYTLQAVYAANRLGCRKFIGTGSQAEYGLLDLPQISPTSPTNPIQPYGIAKYAAAKLGAEAARKLGMDFLWVRVFSIYGSLDKSTTMISETIRKLRAGERPSFTPATQRWDYLHSSDAGEALYLIGKKSKGCKVYGLGSGQARPLYEYIYDLRDIVAPDAELGIGDVPFTSATVMNLCADISDLQLDTGWEPKTAFRDGIEKILD